MVQTINKTCKWAVILLVTLFVSATFSSCHDDDDDPKPTNNPAAKIAGSYVGKGYICIAGLQNMPLDTYPGMKLQITRSSNEYVIVTPYFADGKPVFSGGSGDVYYITQTAGGDFLLTNSETPSATLTIKKTGQVDYYYPYLSINGEGGYALVFNGEKEL